MTRTKSFFYDEQDNEVEVDVEFNWSPGDPGRVWGPPEHCYPPEPPELEILSIKRSDTLAPVVDELDCIQVYDRVWDDIAEGVLDEEP